MVPPLCGLWITIYMLYDMNLFLIASIASRMPHPPHTPYRYRIQTPYAQQQ